MSQERRAGHSKPGATENQYRGCETAPAHRSTADGRKKSARQYCRPADRRATASKESVRFLPVTLVQGSDRSARGIDKHQHQLDRLPTLTQTPPELQPPGRAHRASGPTVSRPRDHADIPAPTFEVLELPPRSSPDCAKPMHGKIWRGRWPDRSLMRLQAVPQLSVIDSGRGRNVLFSFRRWPH